MKTPQGFSLVEVAVVIMIVGLLLGGVLKAQELITNAKIKNLESNFNSLSKAVALYQERYGALPGDDGAAQLRFGLDNNTNGNANGLIEGDYQLATGESGLVWRHLRAAQLVTGSAQEGSAPSNAFGGTIGIGMNDTLMPWVFIGFTRIPKKIGLIFDERYDGITNSPLDSGRIRAEDLGELLGNDPTVTQFNLLFAL